MGFQEKPKSAVQKTNADNGEMRTIIIEKHEKESDLRKQVSRFQKLFGAEVLERTEEGVTVRYPVARAEEYHAQARAKAMKLAKMPAAVKPDQQYSGISKVDKDTVEQADIRALMGD